MKYIIVFLLGIAVATVGLSGVASLLDRTVSKTQQAIKDSVEE